MRTRTLRHVAVSALVLALAGCGASAHISTTCAHRSGFELSLVRDRGGRPTPVAAADWFSMHAGIRGIPRSGWRLTSEHRGEATLVSHQTAVHAIQGSDGTWQVDGGYACVAG